MDAMINIQNIWYVKVISCMNRPKFNICLSRFQAKYTIIAMDNTYLFNRDMSFCSLGNKV